MPVFPLLREPASYRPCPWPLADDSEKRAYWLNVFRTHFVTLIEHAREEAADRGVQPPPIEEATRLFMSWLDEADVRPGEVGKQGLNILECCRAREEILIELGFGDPYRLAKQRENERAVALYPSLIQSLDAMTDDDQRIAVMQGVFAGNIFDLGAPETIERFRNQAIDFHAIRQELKPRPYLFDDLDSWLAHWQNTPPKRAVLFVDNAGPDIVLGMVPFARALLKRGTKVVLTANTLPSLNDVTHDELQHLMKLLANVDDVLREALDDATLTLVPSGNGLPLIDLRDVSDELVQACNKETVDLVVLEGMGRSVESNFDATFTCPVLHLAMIKDLGVAQSMGGTLYDLVLRFAS